MWLWYNSFDESSEDYLMDRANKIEVQTSLRKKMGLSFAVFSLILVIVLCWIGVLGGNVHAVIPGKVYRSAQLSGKSIQALSAQLVGNSQSAVMKNNGIRTVINLRGGSLENEWYRQELNDCAKIGAKHIDISMSARRMPPPDMMLELLKAFDTAQYPLLIHCQGGSDRTGLASTIYLNLYEKIPLDTAEQQQLTFRYGHISWGTAHPMDDFFNLYRSTGKVLGLRTWMTDRYPSLYAALPADQKSPASDQVPSKSKNSQPMHISKTGTSSTNY